MLPTEVDSEAVRRAVVSEIAELDVERSQSEQPSAQDAAYETEASGGELRARGGGFRFNAGSSGAISDLLRGDSTQPSEVVVNLASPWSGALPQPESGRRRSHNPAASPDLRGGIIMATTQAPSSQRGFRRFSRSPASFNDSRRVLDRMSDWSPIDQGSHDLMLAIVEVQAIESTVNALRNHEVTRAMIREHWQARPSDVPGQFCRFASRDRDAMIYLVTGRGPRNGASTIVDLPEHLRLQPVDALQAISGLDNNQLSALMCCYQAGLRPAHLRSALSFPYLGVRSLRAMIVDQSMNPDVALVRLTQGLSSVGASSLALSARSQRGGLFSSSASTDAIAYQAYDSNNEKRWEAITLHAEHAKESLPEGFKCPITLQVMDDPVFLGSATQACERTMLAQWLAKDGAPRHPITRQHVTMDDETPEQKECAAALLVEITSWLNDLELHLNTGLGDRNAEGDTLETSSTGPSMSV